MGKHCAWSTLVGAEIVPVMPRSFLEMHRPAPAWSARTHATDDDEGLNFANVPVSEVELPSDGGGSEASMPRLTVLSSVTVTEVEIEEVPEPTRAERARQVIRSMLRAQERAAS